MQQFTHLPIIFLVAVAVVMVAFFIIVRTVYHRSMRIRNQLQMSYIFTSITHELLTPLTIIAASVERLRNADHSDHDSPGADRSNNYDLMELNIQRMQRLLQQILETSKSHAGELKLLVSNGDVMQYIKETALTIEPLMASKGLSFTISCRPESMMGWIDTDKLDKIIFNLLSNAAKYTPRGGRVALNVATNKRFDRIVIRVSDNGNGIAKEQMKHLFTRYHDGDYRKNQTFGTGIGLSLTRDLVHLHRGTIHCKSLVGQGTTFTVELPINKEAFADSQIDEKNRVQISSSRNTIVDLAQRATAVQPVNEAEVTAPPEASRVLIVEDNTELLMLMRQLLQHRYHIQTATNGREALEVIRSQPLDIIVSDVMMPDMDGLELTTTVKQDPDYNHLPVILLTARTQEEDRAEALLAGADAYITKPFRLRDLQLSIDNIVTNRQRILHDANTPDADANHMESNGKRLSPMDAEFLQRAMRCINEHINDSDYDRDTFAADMGASASTLYNKLRALTGMNVTAFIRKQRIKTACRLAKSNPDLRVSDIAYRVGFKDPKYFATTFKRETGQQPKEYFERLRGNRLSTVREKSAGR